MRNPERLLAALLVALALMFSAAARAGEAAPAVDDPVLEKRVQRLSEELRCLVCQNQTIADSHADLAIDLKREIRGLIKAGKGDQEILDFMVQRYGDFVLYRPPVKPTTWVLWVGPFVLLVGGVVVLFVKLRGRQRTLRESDISEADHLRARALLDSEEKRDPA